MWNRAGNIRRGAVVVIASVMAVGALAMSSPASAGTPAQRPPRASTDARAAALARALGNAPSLAASGSATGVQADTVTGPGRISDADAVGDADSRVDISNVSATMRAGRVRFGLTLPSTPDPRSDPGWQVGLSYAAWAIDATGDDVQDYLVAVLVGPGTQAFGLVISADGNVFYCNANAAYTPSSHTFGATVPLRCIGNPTHINFAGGARYDTNPFGDVPNQLADFAPDATSLPLDVGVGTPVLAGGYLVNGFGTLRSFNAAGSVSHAHGGPVFGFDIARGVAATPDGGHAYEVDGYGGLHGVEIGTNSVTAKTVGGPYWNGWDIVRGVAVAPTGRGGYVLDGYGGLHAFAIGSSRNMAAVIGGPYWNGWDIARGVAVLPNGQGGFVVDGFGGLHWFSFGKVRPVPTIVGSVYWQGQDRARGVTILPDGKGGFVVDSSGALHPFGIGGPAPALPSVVLPFAARGVTVVPTLLPLPALAPPLP